MTPHVALVRRTRAVPHVFVLHRWALIAPCIAVLLTLLALLPARTYAASFTVTTTNDSGPGSLRQAILDANGSAGPDTITFNISGGGVHTIQPTSALPTITDEVSIDGTSQLGFVGTPLIELNGVSAGANASGLVMNAGNSSVRGLVINRFGNSGILLQATSNNTIVGNYIGTDVTGTVALGNHAQGIFIENTSNNIIGGTSPETRNIISGNNASGIEISNTSATTITGNYIGTDATGTVALGNGQAGISLLTASTNTVIGGMTSGARNIISGNAIGGIGIAAGANQTRVQGNYIGTNVDGTAAIPNGSGIYLSSADNSIGGTAAGAGNLISGNSGTGVYLINTQASGNHIQGNYIGVNATGTAALPNDEGIGLVNAPNNIIGGTTADARNLISGNIGSGIAFSGTNATGNVVEGNYIGTDVSGTQAIPNATIYATRFSCAIFLNASGNTIGGTVAGARNIISGDSSTGVTITSNGSGNTVAGNYIGTDVSGTKALGNPSQGILLDGGANNIIGGTVPEARNVISGNGRAMLIQGASASGNRVIGNYMGVDASGATVLPNLGYGIEVRVNAHDNQIGGNTPAERNVISGNFDAGLAIYGAATANTVSGNYIGTDASGTGAIPNQDQGITLQNTTNNIIGGTTAGARNLISGNGDHGIRIFDAGTTGNQIIGNYIGTDVSGTTALKNVKHGIIVYNGATNNIIGGTAAGAGNLVSGNGDVGISIQDPATTGNVVEGNAIGINAAGTAALGNTREGIEILGQTHDNRIGGTTPAERNVISGNGANGIAIYGAATANTVSGNYIGTNTSGTAAIPNQQQGITLQNATNNIIGGTTSGARNVISGNGDNGVYIITSASTGNQVFGNYIGTDVSGTTALANSHMGVYLLNGASNNVIGGTSASARNVISGNGDDGISVLNATTTGNVVQGNYIGTNTNGTAAVGNRRSGISLYLGPTNTQIGGTATGAGNLISGNVENGIVLNTNVTGSVIQGNYIGTNAAGTAAIDNAEGIVLAGGSHGNLIGGTNAAARNVISGNDAAGILIYGAGTDNNLVQGNAIGTTADGRAEVGNRKQGVLIRNDSSSTIIGTPDAGNVIAFNGGVGVQIDSGVSNSIRGNSIFDNSGVGIDLGNNGVYENDNTDTNDDDSGANNLQNYPFLFYAVPGSSTTVITGSFSGAANTTLIFDFYANFACNVSNHGDGRFYLGSVVTTTDSSGGARYAATFATVLPPGQFVTATATDANGNTSEFSNCVSTGPDNDVWTTAYQLSLAGTTTLSATLDQYIDVQGESRWYKFTVQPGSQVQVSVTGLDGGNLPADYDLVLFKDISAVYSSTLDLAQLNAEAAAASHASDAIAPGALEPQTLVPDAYTSKAFQPDNFESQVIAPHIVSPHIVSPHIVSPHIVSPHIVSPHIVSPHIVSPEAYSSAQARSMIGVSALDGTARESIIADTWNNTGSFYVRVSGNNGIFSTQAPFRIQATMVTADCAGVQPIQGPTTEMDGTYQTIILSDTKRIEGSDTDKAILNAKLVAFAKRREVDGLIVDLSQSARIQAARAQIMQHPDCPFAVNLLAGEIKAMYQNVQGVKYVVIVGSDDVIPFFRSPDNAPLGPESDYSPPVRNSTPSDASLQLRYVLGQDAYGAHTNLSLGNDSFPIPDAAVGRLVETPTDIITVLNAYLATPKGVVRTSTSALVTGYDFMADAATSIKNDLGAGLRSSTNSTPLVDTLITTSTISYQDPHSWTADDLRAQLLGSTRHDLVFLGGHFSASSALSADFRTDLAASEVAVATTDLSNTVVFSNGCHSGYNIVVGDAVPAVTAQPDWARAFAQKGATLIAGTGYQYGDTDFVAYDEQIYVDFTKQLRMGTGPVSVGQALVAAKRAYLARTPQLQGIDDKALRIVTLYGLPMLQVDLPSRIPIPVDQPVVAPRTTVPGDGSALGLQQSDITVTSPLTLSQPLTLTDVASNTTYAATYLSGNDGITIQPGEPVLPLEIRNVSVGDTVLRGVGFRGGLYTDETNVLPLVSAPATELRGVHLAFSPRVLYPSQPWSVNYFDALSTKRSTTALTTTRLIVTPAQFIAGSPDALTGTRRKFDTMDFRLFYSNNTAVISGTIPAQSSAPALSNIQAHLKDGALTFSVEVSGDRAAGIQEVWVVYTATSGPLHGRWTPLTLVNVGDGPTWMKTLEPAALMGTPVADIRYMVQVANGVGLVTLANNQGNYYTPDFDAAALPTPAQQPAVLTLQSTQTIGAYGTAITVSADLTSDGYPLANQPIIFNLGAQSVQATTNAEGHAQAMLTLLGTPSEYTINAVFDGTPDLTTATAPATSFTLVKQDSVLTLTPSVATELPATSPVLTATLEDAQQHPLAFKTVFFVVTGASTSTTVPVITDYAGRASLDALPLPTGTYTVDAYFGGAVPGINVSREDDRYNPTTAKSTLQVLDTPSFPQTPVLDDFNSPDGVLSNNWFGGIGFEHNVIRDKHLLVRSGGLLVWRTGAPFGRSQEAYITLQQVSSTATAQALLLKVQGDTVPDWRQGAIGVSYDARANNGGGAVLVGTYRPGYGERRYASVPAAYQAGDQLGARVLTTGAVAIYRNGVMVTTITLTNDDQQFFNDKGGRIGLGFIDASGAGLDDFGGGTSNAP